MPPPISRCRADSQSGDGRRIDAVGSVDGTSFLSAKDAPRKTGFKVPLNGQPIQGFSGIKSVGDGSYWVLTDNGFGAKANSSDAHADVPQGQAGLGQRQGRDARHDLPARP